MQLAGDVVLLLAEISEPDVIGNLGVDLDERVDDALADRSPAGLVETLGILTQPEDRALDELHHVEGRIVDRLVGAVAGDRGDGDRSRGEGRDDPVLAAHVVGGAERLAHRRAPQRPARAGGIGQAICEIGASAGDPVVA